MMKKMFAALLSLMLVLTGAAALASDDGTAYDAFATLSSGQTINACLDEVMSGSLSKAPASADEARQLAPRLAQLTSVTTKDIAVYAASNNLSDKAVSKAYYQALQNVLDAELMINPDSAARYKDVQALLDLQQRSTTTSTTTSAKTSSGSTSAKVSAASVNRNTNTPDRNTVNTPDRNTKNTPDRNTPDTPDRNTKNTPDRNTPNTPDRNTKDTPDRNT